MRTSNIFFIPMLIVTCVILITALPGRSSFASKSQSSTLALDTLEGLDIRSVPNHGLDPAKVTSDVATYRGRRAVHMVNDDSGIVKGNRSGGESLAIVKERFRYRSLFLAFESLSVKVRSPCKKRGGVTFHC